MPTAEAEQLATTRQLVLAQDSTRVALTLQAIALASQSARSFDGWYQTGEITAWATALSKQIEALQRVLAQSTDAYLARVSTLLTGRRVRPVGAVDVATLRRGTTHPGVYGRAADVYRYQQSRVTGPDARAGLVSPLDAALQRVTVLADTDAQLAVRAQSQKFMVAQRTLTGYRRVIHPERSKGGTCGLCAAASTRLYGPHELMPIHARCECTPLPVYDHADPGAALNDADIAQLYKDAGSTGADALKRVRYQVSENAELGPVLHLHGSKFRGPRAVAKAA